MELPGRCLEVYGGAHEEHRIVDIWDCHGWAWQHWRYLSETWGAPSPLQNVQTGKCLHVYSLSPTPARLEQSSDCSTAWQIRATGEVVHYPSGLCLLVNGTVTGKDKDVNYSVPEWANSDNKEWISYAGKANGARVTLGDCVEAMAAGDDRQVWHVQPAAAPAGELAHESKSMRALSGPFSLRSGTRGSYALVGGVPSTCGDARSTQVCSGPPVDSAGRRAASPSHDLRRSRSAAWPSWLLANRATAAAERAAEQAPGSPVPPAGADPYVQLPWLATSFVETQMMVHDRYFFDAAAGNYTVDRCFDL